MNNRRICEKDIMRNLINLRQLTFEVTDDCNLCCKYCGYGDMYITSTERGKSYLNINKVLPLLEYLTSLWTSNVSDAESPITYVSFAGVSASCTIERPDVLFGNNYEGIYSETISVKTNALAKSYRCGFDLGKGFYWKNTNLKSRMDYLFSDVPYLAQDKESRIKSNTLRLVMSLSLEPFNFINVSYSLNMLHTCSRQAMGDSFDPLFTASNILSVTFRIPRGITLALLGDNYINNQASENRSFTLMDATLGFTFRKMSCTVLCRNLLDVKKYVYSNIREASSFSSTYLIRPRDFLFKIVFAL